MGVFFFFLNKRLFRRGIFPIQDWLGSGPQEMKTLLDKLTRENQQIAQLEVQLQVGVTFSFLQSISSAVYSFDASLSVLRPQSQKEQLDLALKAVAVSGDEEGKADLEKENANLRKELLFLPELKTELESLRARVTELSQLIGKTQQPFTDSSHFHLLFTGDRFPPVPVGMVDCKPLLCRDFFGRRSAKPSARREPCSPHGGGGGGSCSREKEEG